MRMPLRHRQIMAWPMPKPLVQIEARLPPSSGVLLTKLQRDIAACRLCSSLTPWRQFESNAYGTTSTGYVLVGEAPGYKSLVKRRRFTGPAGMVIRRALQQLAHPRYRDLEDLFYLTDVVKCHPAAALQSTANRAPRRAEIHSCADHLLQEIHMLQPSIILTFGKIAAEAVATVKPLSKVVAFPHPSPRNQLTIQKHYASRKAFEEAISATFGELIAQLEQRSFHA
jgi:uracil-DNA glycosylase family 4